MTSHPKTAIILRDIATQDAHMRLESISFRVTESSWFALLYSPGSGAETIVKLLAGLVSPETGTGRVLDHDLGDPRINRDHQIGFLYQAMGWSGRLTVSEILHLMWQREIDPPAKNEINELIELAGLVTYLQMPANQLTQAKRQLLGLIALYHRRPSLLILDNPTAHMSSDESKRMIDLITHIGAGRTVFFTTSAYDVAQRLSNHIVLLHQGKILAQGDKETVFLRPETAVFRVRLHGDSQIVLEQLRALAWVSEVVETRHGQISEWIIWLRDEKDVASHLLRAILADRRLQVVEFNQIRPPLDDFLGALQYAKFGE